MAVYGITEEKLAAGEALVNKVEKALNKKKVETGEAQEATRLRDEAVDTFQEWYSDFIAITRIALKKTTVSGNIGDCKKVKPASFK